MAGGVAEETRPADGNLLSDVIDHEIWAGSNRGTRPEENGSRRNRNEKMIVLLGEASDLSGCIAACSFSFCALCFVRVHR